MKPYVHIVHFNPIDRYPPVMNLVRYLSENGFEGFIYTTRNSSNIPPFEDPNFTIRRFGKGSKSRLALYLSYLSFNLGTLYSLLRQNVSVVMCYETYSIFPVYYTKRIKSSTQIYIHYHEYMSNEEVDNASAYFRFLRKIEKMLLPNTKWVSHTNEDRMRMFLYNNIANKPGRTEILPNYPPQNWYNRSIIRNKVELPVKFIYVGALSFEATYVKAFADWICEKSNDAIWDIYSDNMSIATKDYLLEKQKSGKIRLMKAVDYYNLPDTITQYDIGVIIYNGNIPNYIYNAPNKLFEYLACGLDVWISKDIIGCNQYITQDHSPKVIYVDFQQLDPNLIELVGQKKPERKQPTYYSEAVYQKLAVAFVGS